MANLFQGTVRQIDGNPLSGDGLVMEFPTSNIYIRAAAIPLIPEVNSVIVCFIVVNNQLQQQSFYVEETIQYLCGNYDNWQANSGRTTLALCSVVEINGDPLNAAHKYAFPGNEIITGNLLQTTNSGANGSIIFKGVTYLTTESGDTILNIANNTVSSPAGPQGIQGPVGPQGPIGPVGPAGLTWKGAWTSGTSYILNDAVGYGGASYFCILATSGTTNPVSDTTHWALLAAQGAQGPQGATGAQGPTGATGPAGTGVVLSAKVSLTSAQLLSLSLSNRIVLVPAAGPGTIINPVAFMLKVTRGTTLYSGVLKIAFNSGGSDFVQSTALGNTTDVIVKYNSTPSNGNWTFAAINDNLSIYSNSLTGGDGSVDVYILYSITTL